MSFNLRDWCPLHRAAVLALRAELADLRSFVRANVLNGDEASRLLAKIGKADEKFGAVEASGESLILAFEADCSEGQGETSGPGDGSGSSEGSGPATLATGQESAPAVGSEAGSTESPAAETPAAPAESVSPAGDKVEQGSKIQEHGDAVN